MELGKKGTLTPKFDRMNKDQQRWQEAVGRAGVAWGRRASLHCLLFTMPTRIDLLVQYMYMHVKLHEREALQRFQERTICVGVKAGPCLPACFGVSLSQNLHYVPARVPPLPFRLSKELATSPTNRCAHNLSCLMHCSNGRHYIRQPTHRQSCPSPTDKKGRLS